MSRISGGSLRNRNVSGRVSVDDALGIGISLYSRDLARP